MSNSEIYTENDSRTWFSRVKKIAASAALAVGLTVIPVAVAEAAPAQVNAANCVGAERASNAYPNGADLGRLIVEQHIADRANGTPDSFGQSLSGAASTNCYTK